MGRKILSFGNIETENYNFYCNESPFFKDVDIANILLSNKIYFGEKAINTLLVTYSVILKLSFYE